MKKSFLARVMKEFVVDTKNYRYVYEYSSNMARFIVKRIRIDYLDTMAAYDPDNWEVIA